MAVGTRLGACCLLVYRPSALPAYRVLMVAPLDAEVANVYVTNLRPLATYCSRSASSGLTRVALRAGTKLATSTVPRNTTATTP